MTKNLLLAIMLSIFTAGQVSAQNGQQSISLTTDIPIGDTLKVALEIPPYSLQATGVEPDYICINDTIYHLVLTQNTVTLSAPTISWFSCEHQLITSLNVGNATSLKGLDCGNNRISVLNLSQNAALETLMCSGNAQLGGTLNLANNPALIELGCSGCPISNISLPTNNSLEILWVSSCPNLTGLSLTSMPALKTLACNNTPIQGLNLSNNTNLEYLYCQNTNLTTVNVANNTSLRELWCNDNNLSSLNVTGASNLTDLYCFNCNLSQFSVANCTSLERLFCQHNQIGQTALTNLINSLPYHQPTDDNLELYEFCYYDDYTGSEHNYVPTSAQINSCYNRGWSPKYVVFDTTIQYPIWIPYPQPNLSFNAMKQQRGQTTEIRSIADIDANDHALWYDMQGRCMSKPTRSGLYIHNEKKVYIK